VNDDNGKHKKSTNYFITFHQATDDQIIFMCIYYKEIDTLTYTAGEHIFPAALGGIQKLSKDFVSSEFNNAISGLELDFIRNSFVAVARQVEGPGKKGKLSDRYATKSTVSVIESAADKTILALGYIKKGKLYEIPQVLLNTDTAKFAISFDSTAVTDIAKAIADFKGKCSEAELLKIKIIDSELLPMNQIILGIDDSVETNFNCFFAKHPSATTRLSVEKIKAIGNALQYDGTEPQRKKYMPRSTGQIKFSVDFFRIYGKIAFNFLAFLKGQEFVMATAFDQVRNWIANGGANKFAALNTANFNPLKEMKIELPESCHHVLIYKIENRLFATIHLYEALSVDIELDPNYTGKFSTDGFICDWKNRKEYKLFEYISEKYVL